ncbi:complement C1q-like protein 4 [Engraulis encrasicolus]|uniref:complement C1q-like protein 4 n=1 Tax=Engraulis encrasicolus TaxID=184585 RepID=UPI002FD27E06
MKTAGVVLLLLWFGQVVIAAHNPDVKTTNTGKDAVQQSDIHTVLREMSILIAQQGEQLKCTKTQLEAVQKKAEDMENRLRDSESLVNQLKTENKVQSADLNATVTAVSDLKRERAQSRVSFSAILLGEGSREHSGVDTLVFQLPITNIGNAYNRQDGKFRAPIRGVYWFAVYIYGHGRKTHSVGVSLRKNGEHVAIAYAVQPSGGINTSNGASLLLEKGDQVWVQVWPGALVFDNYNKHTTFSGHLLFAM